MPLRRKISFPEQYRRTNSDAFSNYDALQITLNERPMHGLAFLAAYTYSHALDVYSMANNTTPSVIDAYNIRLNYGNSNFDIRHRFTFSPIYVIPGIKSPGQMLQGWAVSGILTLYGGLPWFPSDTTDDLLGTNEFKDGLAAGPQPWNYSGPVSAFRANSSAFPCYNNTANGNSPMSGCTSSTANVQAAQAWSSCQTAAVAPYGGNAQLQSLALASLNIWLLRDQRSRCSDSSRLRDGRQCQPQRFPLAGLPQRGFLSVKRLEIQGAVRRAVPGRVLQFLQLGELLDSSSR